MKILAVTAIAAATLLGGAAVAQTIQSQAQLEAPAQPATQSAGLCVRLNDKGEVVDAQIAQTSGDPALDENAVALAKTLQWAPPFPKAGWLGVRVTLSNDGPSPTPAAALHELHGVFGGNANLALHVAGALKHQFDGSPVLWRMLPLLKPPAGGDPPPS